MVDRVASLILGIVLVVFGDKLAKKTVELQKKTWGFKFGGKETSVTKFGLILLGVFLIATSLLTLLGVHH